ncbi:MAG TPA: DUF4331 family protein [Polyangiaceae bacterium]|jgi:hypothetical protein
MKTRVALACTAVAAAGALAVLSVGHASDHLDGPRTTADPQADITDVFAFTSPEDPSKVVLAMAVTPYASDASTFSSDVEYAFRVQLVDAINPLSLSGAPLDVVCDLADEGGAPTMTCNGPQGSTGSAVVGATGGSAAGSIRVFAGLRSDPAFFDRQGALATIQTGVASFTGTNAFAGANVLAIVVELDSTLFSGDSGARPVLAVAAETVRGSP